MVFSTIIFLFRFLPITLALYYLAPAKLKNTVLFLCSLVFYCWGSSAAPSSVSTAAAGKSDSSQRAGESNCKDFCAIYHKIFLLLFKTFLQLPKAVLHQGRLLLSYHNCVQNATKSPSVLRIFNR